MSSRFENAIARIQARRRIRRRARERRGEAFCSDDKHCLRPIFRSGRCLHHFTRWLDIAWGQRVRKPYCEIDRIHLRHGIACSGRIEACHIIPRGFLLTRWHLENGLSGCHAANQIGEDDPLMWEAIAKERIGEDHYTALWLTANEGVEIDYDAVMKEVGLA